MFRSYALHRQHLRVPLPRNKKVHGRYCLSPPRLRFWFDQFSRCLGVFAFARRVIFFASSAIATVRIRTATLSQLLSTSYFLDNITLLPIPDRTRLLVALYRTLVYGSFSHFSLAHFVSHFLLNCRTIWFNYNAINDWFCFSLPKLNEIICRVPFPLLLLMS